MIDLSRHPFQDNFLTVTCKRQCLHANASNRTHEHRLHEQTPPPLKGTPLRASAQEWHEIRHLSAWQAMRVFFFRALQRDELSAEAHSLQRAWQNLWSPAASGSHYPCLLLNKLPYCARSWGAWISSVAWHNFDYLLFSQCVHNIVPLVNNAWLEWKAGEVDFHVIVTSMLTLSFFFLYFFLSQTSSKALVCEWNHRQITGIPPTTTTSVAGGISVPVLSCPIFNSLYLAGFSGFELSARNCGINCVEDWSGQPTASDLPQLVNNASAEDRKQRPGFK